MPPRIVLAWCRRGARHGAPPRTRRLPIPRRLKDVRRRLAAVFGTIGEWSLQIYLLHIFIIVSLAALLEFLLPPLGGVLGALIVTAAAVLTTYVAVLLSKLTTKVRWLYIPPGTVRRRSRKPVGDTAA